MLPIPAPYLHDMNCRLIEWTACIDRHHLKRLAADHDLIVLFGRKAVEPNKGTKSFIGFVNTATPRPRTCYIRSRVVGRSLRV
jgi:hypothetical protein